MTNEWPHEPALRAEIRFKNARLYDAINAQSVSLSTNPREQGCHRTGPIKAWCDLNHLDNQYVYQLLNLKIAPFAKYGRNQKPRIRPICERIAVLLDMSVEWLFPADLYSIKWPTMATYLDHHKFVPLLAAGRTVLALPPTQHDNIEADELRHAISTVLTTITPREELVIRARFGLDGPEQALEDIAESLKVSRERVRQIEAKALRKLRHKSRTKPLCAASYYGDLPDFSHE